MAILMIRDDDVIIDELETVSTDKDHSRNYRATIDFRLVCIRFAEGRKIPYHIALRHTHLFTASFDYRSLVMDE